MGIILPSIWSSIDHAIPVKVPPGFKTGSISHRRSDGLDNQTRRSQSTSTLVFFLQGGQCLSSEYSP